MPAWSRILTDVDEDVILDNPRLADLVADDGDLTVYTVTDELRDALATSDSDQLAEAAEPLVELEELDGADPETILSAARGAGRPGPPSRRTPTCASTAG